VGSQYSIWVAAVSSGQLFFYMRQQCEIKTAVVQGLNTSRLLLLCKASTRAGYCICGPDFCVAMQFIKTGTPSMRSLTQRKQDERCHRYKLTVLKLLSLCSR